MKKIIITILILSATFCFSNSNGNDRQGQREMREPPSEAISICESQSAGDSCSVTTPRGDTVEGTCENTPDDKYFACKPSNMQNHRPQ